MAKTTNEYAKALVELAVENNKLDEFYVSLKQIREYFTTFPDYLLLLSSPALTLDERIECIDKAFSVEYHEYVVSFLKILCENGSMGEYFDFFKDFEEIKIELQNRAFAKIYSVYPLTDEQKQKLLEKLSNRYSKQITAEFFEDKTLIGGIKVEVDGEILDRSVKKNLSNLKEVIIQ